ncbi:DUF1903-domain-containing protein [Daldinia caldariorum]|uniref:DUF1903-domain-containing protein n=1 Tax=Daldinia caldariorum TaxID=326644 RepID=UPI002007991C|nr:DUF1903-domain-containing protein [Daldinia caldariorum]KAI1467454.1 DUF1903-domain-containing protein [Daldinia caldariorum]
MGLKEDLESNPPCHPRACAIQDCLAKNGYDEAKCSRYIDALYECCDAFYRQHGDEATSACCPKASLLRLKMKQRRDEQSK